MKIIADYSIEELNNLFAEKGEPRYRAKQIFKSVHSGKSFSEMTDIKKQLRDELVEEFIDKPCEIIKELKSKDGTRKFLFKLYDGNVVEGVLMKYKYGKTQCVSTQVGCRMGCAFCASTVDGLVRNLTAGEILGQILAVNRLLGGTVGRREVTNVVLMGSGEPLDNYDAVISFLRLASDPEGINISPRNISLSTCGIVPRMRELAREGLPVNLTVSLHSPFDEARARIMPVAKKYKISEIISACKEYFEATGRRIYFEYSLIRGENDTDACAKRLSEILRGFPCHVNLIKLNSVKERNLLSTTDEAAAEFLKKLENGGLSATIRRQTGADIDGACGQLRRKFIGGGNQD